ncbi:MAG: hypothetical protein E6G59_01120 [Actinobacteria bacterium]|nr:MAG: hypothetical protein E6G59_01120 [Actinomycetota bacterium]
MTDYPIKLGSILFTLVEPHKGHEVDYNRWYERDHFYAGCMVGPGILAGKRWVATKPYKELRYPESTPIAKDPKLGSYLATYWIEASQSQEWGAWGGKEVHRLHKEDRMFEERDHIHTKMYRYRGGVSRDPDGVPPEIALDHGFKGLAVTFVEGEDRKLLDRWYRETYLPRAQQVSPVAMTLAFTAIPIPSDAPGDVPRVADDEKRMLYLSFLDSDPMEVWDPLFVKQAEEVEAGGFGRVIWAGAFIPTIPGTDTYTDQLW